MLLRAWSKSDGKAQLSGGSRGVRVLPRVGGGVPRTASSGRFGWTGRLTKWWCGWANAVMGLQDSGVEGSYGRGYERARERVVGWDSNVWKRGSLAGLIRVCSVARRRVPRILRPVLRSTLRPVLRRI